MAAPLPPALPDDSPDTGLYTPLEFAPTHRGRSLLLAAGLVALGVAIVLSLDDMVLHLGQPWRLLVAACVAVPTAWLVRTLLRQAMSRQPVLRLDARGISGAGLQPPVPWNALEDATLERGGFLRLHRRPDAAHPDATRFWDGHNPARPRVSLHLLNAQQQDMAYDAIHARLDVLRIQAGAGESTSRRLDRVEAEFEDRLDALTPTPWALYLVVAANVLVWAMNVAAGLSITRPVSPELFAWGANAASAVVLDGQWWRLLTATFLHGGIVHLAFNMLGLWEAGKQLCRLLGNGQFLLVYLATGLCGSAASLHYAAQDSVSVGASGAVFGVLGALLAASWHYRHLVPATNLRRLWTGLGFFIGYSLLHGLSQQNVDNAAHVGGLAGGVVLGLVLLAPVDALASHGRRRGRAALAGGATAMALVYAVLATPVPPTWYAQVYAAQRVLPDVARRFDQAFRKMAQDNQRLARGEIRRPAFLANAERDLAPACSAIVDTLAPMRVPLWDATGRQVALYTNLCSTAVRSLRLESAVLSRAPGLPADANAQLERMSGDMNDWLRQLVEDVRRVPLPAGGPRGRAPAP